MQSSPRFDVFFNSLRDLGYVDGQTIVIHYLSADEKDDRFPALASECLRVKADIIAVSSGREEGNPHGSN
jgi:putative ABC transport system substrate-binding protein